MPHISIKMLQGRTEEQKKKLCNALVKTLTTELGCSKQYVTCAIEDYDAVQWQDVFQQEVSQKADKLYKKAEYDPKDLL